MKPAANLFQLEEVLVITQTQTNIAPRAQQDLARGAVAAETIGGQSDGRRAADLLSERLPSLHDIDPKYVDPGEAKVGDGVVADAVAAAKEAGGTVPKPLPTLHADHFTPGTTPPASSLTPGAPALAVSPDQTPTVTPTPHRTPRATPPPVVITPSPASTEPPQ